MISIQIPLELNYKIKRMIFGLLNPLVRIKRNIYFKEQIKKGINNIPIFIINFNRVSYLSDLISQLEKRGFKNIKIIDNCSDYPPLLEFYDKIKYDVYKLEKNYGHMAFWKCECFDEYRKNFYIVTDPDLEIINECPNDFVERFFYLLWKYPFVRKVGFSLKVDDLPDDVPWVKDILEWESQFNKVNIKKDHIYYASIDTTFALYVPDQIIYARNFLSAFRTEFPYQVKHLPWYKSSDDVSEEDIYYSNHKKNGWWDSKKGVMSPDEI